MRTTIGFTCDDTGDNLQTIGSKLETAGFHNATPVLLASGEHAIDIEPDAPGDGRTSAGVPAGGGVCRRIDPACMWPGDIARLTDDEGHTVAQGPVRMDEKGRMSVLGTSVDGLTATVWRETHAPAPRPQDTTQETEKKQ